MSDDDSAPRSDRERSYSGGYMKAGRAAEEIVMRWMRGSPMVVEVKDLHDNADAQLRGIDAAVTLLDDRQIMCEIKSDGHLDVSGNWLFELCRVNFVAPLDRQFVIGWSVRSESSHLFFYAPSVARIHRILMHEYRQGAVAAFRDERVRLHLTLTDRIKQTVNALCPEEYFTRQPSHRVIQL